MQKIRIADSKEIFFIKVSHTVEGISSHLVKLLDIRGGKSKFVDTN
jgi:hypothetical protein